MWGMTFEKSLRLFWPRPVAETDARGSSEGRTPRRSRRADAPQTHNREAEMNADKTIQITATEHLITLGIVVGLTAATAAIEKAQTELKLPGIRVARNAVLAEEAQARMQLMQENLRLAFATWGSLEGCEVHCSSHGVVTLTDAEGAK